MEPQRWVDEMEPRWREVWARLDIAYDDYIRTTEPRHEEAVVKLLDQVHGTAGTTSTSTRTRASTACRASSTTRRGPPRGRAVSDPRAPGRADEGAELLLPALGLRDRLWSTTSETSVPGRARGPAQRGLSLIRGGLQDFSISRTNFDWGIPLPWDPDHVCRWFDALTNYITAAGYGSDEEPFARMWPANIHMIGKDILRQHAIYWPAMLMAAGVEPPNRSGPTGSSRWAARRCPRRTRPGSTRSS